MPDVVQDIAVGRVTPHVPFPDSKTHRLCFVQGECAPGHSGYIPLPHTAADELEGLRAFVSFLYPPGGQDRFQLLRPDMLEMRWCLYDKDNKKTYTLGTDPRTTVAAAIERQKNELSRNEFSLEKQ